MYQIFEHERIKLKNTRTDKFHLYFKLGGESDSKDDKTHTHKRKN